MRTGTHWHAIPPIAALLLFCACNRNDRVPVRANAGRNGEAPVFPPTYARPRARALWGLNSKSARRIPPPLYAHRGCRLSLPTQRSQHAPGRGEPIGISKCRRPNARTRTLWGFRKELMMALIQRLLDFQFNLGVNKMTGVQQNFAEGGAQVYVTGLRASANIVIAGGLSMGHASVAIYGMTLSLINQLSTLGLNPRFIGPNFITILAGNSEAGMAVVYEGAITSAWMDAAGMPQVAFRVEADAGSYQAITPCPPRTFKGPVSAAVICAGLAAEMGLSFSNYGVTTILPPSYYWGSQRNQVIAVCEDAGCLYSFDFPGRLVIWNPNETIGTTVSEISPETGMKGYPTYTSYGVEVETLFNPNIGYWSNINVTSQLTPACGTWTIHGLEHHLESQMPHGAWFSTIQAHRPGSTAQFGAEGNALPPP